MCTAAALGESLPGVTGGCDDDGVASIPKMPGFCC